MTPAVSLEGYSYTVKVFGCQMNKHDGERVCGLLESCGATPASDVDDSDIIVYLTCCVREAADVRALGQVASLKNSTAPHGKKVICIGGCIGQRDGAALIDELPFVSVVFGTMNIESLPALVAAALAGEGPVVETRESLEHFSSELPCRREQPWHAWVSITSGCNNFCSYCIVPYVRGRERSRSLESIEAEIASLAEQGVAEITLLGQNVNSYGRDLYGAPRFADVLHMAGQSGIPRVRFATSHPKDLSDETIQAMATEPAVMPQLHLPVQSGSDPILKAMHRRYTRDHYLRLVEKVHEAVPGILLSTDVIVGFPGETEADFADTLTLVQQVGYAQAFTFIYSKRAGTPAATMPDSTPRDVIQERFDRLVEAVQQSAWEANQPFLGTEVDVLVEGLSKRDKALLVGRTPHNQVVHAPLPAGRGIDSLLGTFVPVHIDVARTWYLSGQVVGHE